MKPSNADHPEYFRHYISLVKQNDINAAIRESSREVMDFVTSLDPKLGDYAYATGKWTLKEVLIHCIDTERIFSTRALCFARGERQKALSFDENAYAPNSEAQARTLQSIATEMASVQLSTLHLFGSFSDKTLAIKGETPAGPSTVNAIGFTICGHTLHHMAVIRERYLK